MLNQITSLNNLPLSGRLAVNAQKQTVHEFCFAWMCSRLSSVRTWHMLSEFNHPDPNSQKSFKVNLLDPKALGCN